MTKGPTAPVDEAGQDDDQPTQESHTSPVAMLGKYRDFRYVFLGTIGTHSSQWILNVALGWLMLELTNSPFYVGTVGFAGGVPMLLVSVPAGILVDRLNRRSLLLACQVGLALLGITMTALVLLDLIAPWHLLAGAFLNGGFMSLNNATRQSIVPNSVDPADLATAVGMASAGQHTSRIVGPSIAGVLIGLIGAAGAFIFQAVVLTGAIGLTILLSTAVAGEQKRGEPGTGLLAGFRHVLRNPLIRDLVLLAGVLMFFGSSYLHLLPVFARDILEAGPDGLGILMAMSGIGAVTGGLLTSRVSRIPRVGIVMLVLTIAYGAIVALFASSSLLWLSLPLIALSSLTGSIYMALNNTLIHMNITDDVRGRVTGVYMLAWGLFPLGALPAGALADLTSTPFAVAANAVVSSIITGAIILRSTTLRSLGHPQHRGGHSGGHS